jgi:hypothetical protein
VQKDRASQVQARPNWLKSGSQLSHLSSPSQSVFLDWAGLTVAKALINSVDSIWVCPKISKI